MPTTDYEYNIEDDCDYDDYDEQPECDCGCESDCEDCQDGVCQEGHAGVVYNYSHKPHPIFYGNCNDVAAGMNFGIEVEVESNRDDPRPQRGAAIVARHFGEDELYCKWDSSLINGFEIVSHPRTLDSWHEAAPRLVAMTTALRQAGWRSWDANKDGHPVGIHVHVSKTALNPPPAVTKGKRLTGHPAADMSSRHVWMLQNLLYQNAGRAAAFCGRDSHYGSLTVDPDEVRPSAVAKNLRRGGYGNDNRSVAVNFNPENTVEIRAFRGSLNPTRILADIELTHALVEYSRSLTFADWRDGAGEWEVFLLWARRSGLYPNVTEIASRLTRRYALIHA